MWKLICYEWKKLAKSRSNLLLFVVLLAACAYQIKTNVTTDIKDYYFCLLYTSYLLDIALILIFTKVLGLVTKRIEMPQVVGALMRCV